MITYVKVVSRNFMVDFYSDIQNIFGRNLTKYEDMINKGIEQIKKEIRDNNISLIWYKIEITQLTKQAVAIVLYGEEK